MPLSRRSEHRSGGLWPFPRLQRRLPLKETRGLSRTYFSGLGGLPFFHGFPNCVYHKGSGGGIAPPRGPGPVTWGASPSFTED